ncbi:MAG TPA: M23 family peptidase, partial [Ramlibacter sp.]
MKNGFAAACESFLLKAGRALEHHPKQATAVIAALLLGGGGAAFGVASLDPAPDNVVVRQVLEDVAPLPLEPQVQAIENDSISLYRTDTTRLAETVDAFLARMGVDDAAAAAFLRREPTFRAQFLAHAGRSVSVESNERHELVKFTGRWVPDSLLSFKRLVVERAGEAFVSHVETASLTPTVHL